MTHAPQELLNRAERVQARRGWWPFRERAELSIGMRRVASRLAWQAVQDLWSTGTRDVELLKGEAIKRVRSGMNPKFIDPLTLMLIAKIVMIAIELWFKTQGTEGKR